MTTPQDKIEFDAKNFCGTLAVNVDNDKLTDAQFRMFVRNSLDVVDFPRSTNQGDQQRRGPTSVLLKGPCRIRQ